MNYLKKVIRALYRRARAYDRDAYLEKLKERGLRIGKNPKILQDVIIDDAHCWHIEIGDDVTMAPRVHILAHDASTKTFLGYTKIGKVKIGDRVFIGAGTIILPGVTIGDDVVIGAGSIVSGDIPSASVATGNPARVIKTLDEYLRERRREMERYPLFDEKYTLVGGVSHEMRSEMNRKMEEGFGFVV